MLPNRRNSAASSPGIMRNTRCCSGTLSRVWNPTRFHICTARSSWRSWTTANGWLSPGLRPAAALEVGRPIELVMRLVLLAGAERVDQRVVLRLRERGVPVIVARAFAVARRAEQPRRVERVGRDDGRDGIEKGERAGVELTGDRAH